MYEGSNGRPPTSELLDRTPPHDPDAEQGILASVLLAPERMAEVARLPTELFHDPAHQQIWRAMLAVHRGGGRVDAKLLGNALREQGAYEEIGGAPYLATVAISQPTPANLLHYVGIVRELAAKRSLIHAATDLLRGAYNGKPSDELLTAAAEQVQAIRDVAGGRRATVEAVNVASLISSHPHLAESVVSGVLRRGETGNIIAPPKIGKSWLSYGLALAVATGTRWLGKFPCKPGRVLLIDNELHPATLAHRIPAAAYGMGVRQDEYAEFLDVLPLRGRLLDLNGITSELLAIDPGRYDLVILDALYRAMPAGTSENDNAAMAALFNTIDGITGRLNCAWVNIHHSSRGNQSGKEVTDVGAGAGAQSRASDAHIILRPHEEDGAVVLEAVVRSFAPVEPLPLRWTFPIWTPDDALDPSAIKGRKTRGEERQGDRDRDGIDKILTALKSSPATASKLRECGAGGADRIARLLGILEPDGRIASRPAVVCGNKTKEYYLPAAESGVVG